VIRELGAAVLKRAALTMLGVAVKLNRAPRQSPADEELPDAELPPGGGSRTPEAQSLIAAKPAPEEPAEVIPLEGSIEARIAKARGGW